MAHSPAQTTPVPEGRLAVLTMDGRRLLVPQGEIQSLEPLLDMAREGSSPYTVGTIAFAGHWWPVYCLSRELEVLREIPLTRRLCGLLNDGNHQFALVCDQIEPLAEERPRLRPLPVCMATPDSPLLALLIQRGELGCVTSTARLAAFLADLENRKRAYA